MSTAPNQEVSIDQTIVLARQANKAGHSDQAERSLRQVVAMRPGYLPALVALGEVLYGRRDFAGAVLVFEDAVAASPDDLNLKMHLGNALHMAGRPAEAITVFGAVANLKPDHALAFNNLGSAWQALHQLDKAADSYQLSLKADPKQFLANFNLGMMLLTQHRFAAAAQLLARAVTADARHVVALHHLGVALLYQGKHAQAETIFRAVLRLDSRFFLSLRSLGVLLLELGRRPEALETLRAAAEVNPRDAQTQSLIGNALLGMGNVDAGLAELKSALVLDPALVDARVLLASQLIARGEPQQAAVVALAGLSLNLNAGPLRLVAASALRDQEVTELKPAVRKIVLSLVNDFGISTQQFARVVTSVVRNAPFFKPLLDAARGGTDPLAAVEAAQELMADDLLLAALPRIVVVDPEMEAVLTAIRRSYLSRAVAKGYPLSAPDGANGPFVSALARHFFTAEYAQYVQPDEQQKIDALRAKLEESLLDGYVRPRQIEWSLGLYAMYAPLTSIPGWRILLDVPLDKWSEPLAEVIREQVVDKQLEVALAGAVPSLTPINDETSKAFAMLYDANPYPRWRSLSFPVKETIEAVASKLRGEPVPAFPRPTPVLVAGCGTGQHPIEIAMQFPQSRVTALDISAVALGYAARMAERYNVHSITWRRGDLLELGSTEQKYALIDCGGVLHHVKDPAAALAVLRDRLLPGGLLKVSVYSRIARQHVEHARRFVREKGFPDTIEGIREARRAILELPDNSPGREVATSPDFYAASTCRFLAFPVEEHTFTLPQLAALIDKLGLRFLGFDLPPRVLAAFGAANPNPESLADLAAWDRFETAQPLTFDGMYRLWLDTQMPAKVV